MKLFVRGVHVVTCGVTLLFTAAHYTIVVTMLTFLHPPYSWRTFGFFTAWSSQRTVLL